MLLAVFCMVQTRPLTLPAMIGESQGTEDSVSTSLGEGTEEVLDSLHEGTGEELPLRKLTVDSVLATYNEDSILMMLKEGRVVEVGVDSSKIDTVKRDTIAVSKGALDEPVFYTAKDSITFDYAASRANLYGEGKVNYQNLELTADLITMSMDSSLVHAMGREDSTGVVQGKPVFKQGDDGYGTEETTMKYRDLRLSFRMSIQNRVRAISLARIRSVTPRASCICKVASTRLATLSIRTSICV